MPTPSHKTYLFVGPTLNDVAPSALALWKELALLPPVQRGDVAKLAKQERPGIMVIVDGVFHDRLAVGHIEIREAIGAGWDVWGLSSMGAIRAYEMHALGMRGYGEVYRMFFHEEDFRDDEVALLHEPDPPYRAFSEPLVHLRAALKQWCAEGWLNHEDAEEIDRELKQIWFGDRTLPLFARMVRPRCAREAHPLLEERLADFVRYRLKSADLEAFLRSGIFLSGTAKPLE
ncbi:MAG TPA: TfuA-like protein [Chthonomonadaceae bacterium]|nr:TfuA-like protein [Chthonomonadaceae bacterium]